MSQSLVSSVPGVFEKLEELIKVACSERATPIPVFSFVVGEYEPSGYVLIREIKQDPYEWESIGSFQQKEIYKICGDVSVFSGDSPATNPNLVNETLIEVYALFQQCVMQPVMSNRDMPILGTAGPSPYLMVPQDSQPAFGVATMPSGEAGWFGNLSWSFHFEAILTPS